MRPCAAPSRVGHDAPAGRLPGTGTGSADVIGVHEDRRTARLSVLATATLIASGCRAEPIAHYTCRDRTLFGMISDLLGALPPVCATSSSYRRSARSRPYPAYRSVVDVDSIGLTNVVTALNRGVDPAGNDIGDPTGFVVGVALRQGARDRRASWADSTGRSTRRSLRGHQPVFDVDHLLGFLAGTGDGGPAIPVLASIRPLGSLRHAEFLRNEVPGVVLPETVVERMRRAEARAPSTRPRRVSRSRARRRPRWPERSPGWRSPRTGRRGCRRRWRCWRGSARVERSDRACPIRTSRCPGRFPRNRRGRADVGMGHVADHGTERGIGYGNLGA